MKISVIVTAYNREKTIRRCMESVLAGDFKNLQLVAVDDGSTDETADIIWQFAERDSRVKPVFKINGGVASARNAGLNAADGDYVTFLDSDDYFSPDAISVLSAYADGVTDIVLYDAFSVETDGSIKEFPVYHDGQTGIKHGDISPQELLLSNPCPWDRLVKKDLYAGSFPDGIPAFPEGIWYEDFAAMPILAANASCIKYIDSRLVNYVQTEGSIMRGEGYKKHLNDIFMAMDRIREHLNKTYPEETEYLAFEHLLVTGGKRFVAAKDKKQLHKCSSYMKEYFPGWTINRYVKREPLKKRVLAWLIYHNLYGVLRIKI